MNHKSPLLLVLPVLLLAATLLPAAAAPRAATPPLDPDFLGMTIRDPWYDFGTVTPGEPNRAFQDKMGATLAEIGVHWVRLEFLIPLTADVQPGPALDYELSKYDYFINEVAPRNGLKVLGLLGFALVTPDANKDMCHFNDPTMITSHFGGGMNRAMDAWLTRALVIADRFGDRIAAYEVLNEQNRFGLVCAQPATVTKNGQPVQIVAIDPKVVGRMTTKLYRFCRAIAPLPDGEPEHGCRDAQIVLGGLQPHGSNHPGKDDTAITDQEYLAAIFTDPGSFAGFHDDPAHPYFPLDGVGYHPYPREIELSPNDAFVDRGINRMRETLRAVGGDCMQLWVTEVGYNVGFDIDGPKGPRPVQTEAGQAAFLRDVYTSLAARTLSDCGGEREVANVFWFKYEDFPPASGTNAQRWGVVRIPFSDGSCPGGACYAPDGAPELYRQSFEQYRLLGGTLTNRTYIPVVNR